MDEKNNNFNLKLIINDPYLHECRTSYNSRPFQNGSRC